MAKDDKDTTEGGAAKKGTTIHGKGADVEINVGEGETLIFTEPVTVQGDLHIR